MHCLFLEMLVFFNNFDNLNEFITAQVIEKNQTPLVAINDVFITAQVIEKSSPGQVFHCHDVHHRTGD